MRLALALSLLALAPQGTTGEETHPGPRAGIAGIGGFASVSRILFASAPDQPHRLDSVYLFPDRARWRITPIDSRPSERQVVYRFGTAVHEIAPEALESKTIPDGDRDVVLLQMELRRAVMLWPDGFAWSILDGHTEARAARVLARTTGEQREIGSLVAWLDSAGQPERVEARRPDGAVEEALTIQAWQRRGERAWPAEMALRKNGETVWSESVIEVSSRVFYVDSYFLPPDRRGPGTALAGGERIRPIDLQGTTQRVHRLDGEPSWEEALVSARVWIDRAAAEVAPLGHEVDPVPTLELTAQGRPAACVLRLIRTTDPPPEGWTTRGDRPGLALVLAPGEWPDPRAMTQLRKALPTEAPGGQPYARVVDWRGDPRTQLYLPLEP